MIYIYSALSERIYRVVCLTCDIWKEDKQQILNKDYVFESEIIDGAEMMLYMTETNGSKGEEDGRGWEIWDQYNIKKNVNTVNKDTQELVFYIEQPELMLMSPYFLSFRPYYI